MPRYRERVRLEDGLKLDLNNLKRQGYVKPGKSTVSKSICWREAISGEIIAFGSIYSHAESPSEGGSLHIAIEELSQKIRLQAVPRPYGGHQWYFVCPVAGRLSSVLWMPPGARKFGSRETWGRQVAYSSQFAAPHDRAEVSVCKIRYRLGGKGRIGMDDPLPPKPKWMRWRTYEKLTDRCAAYEDIAEEHLFRVVARFLK
jgi:hypothetical protein